MLAKNMTDYAATLDFLKALIWPATVLLIVIMFKSYVEQLLKQLSDRFPALEKVKFGSNEISFTANIVAHQVRTDPQISEGERQAIDQNWSAIIDPIADVIALRLWRTKASAEQLTREILEPTRLSGEEFSAGFLYTWMLRVKKILDVLQALRYVQAKDDRYELTETGRIMFKDVVEHESTILAQFQRGSDVGFLIDYR